MPTVLIPWLTRCMTRRSRIVAPWPDSNGSRAANLATTCLSFLALVVMASGCGKSDRPFDIIPVEGKVTYEDGAPIPGVYVQFVPQAAPLDAKTHPRPGVAGIADDGAIEQVTTYIYGDGIVPGEHKVVVKSGKSKEQRNSVDLKYSNVKTTPLTVNTADIPFDIKIEKP